MTRLLRADLAGIYRRLYDRLSIKQSSAIPTVVGISTIVQPTIDIDPSLSEHVVQTHVGAVTGNGLKSIFTCPANTRRELVQILVRCPAGDFQCNFIQYTYAKDSTLHYLTYPGATNNLPWPHPSYPTARPIIMNPGDQLHCNIVNYANPNNVDVITYYTDYDWQQ